MLRNPTYWSFLTSLTFRGRHPQLRRPRRPRSRWDTIHARPVASPLNPHGPANILPQLVELANNRPFAVVPEAGRTTRSNPFSPLIGGSRTTFDRALRFCSSQSTLRRGLGSYLLLTSIDFDVAGRVLPSVVACRYSHVRSGAELVTNGEVAGIKVDFVALFI